MKANFWRQMNSVSNRNDVERPLESVFLFSCLIMKFGSVSAQKYFWCLFRARAKRTSVQLLQQKMVSILSWKSVTPTKIDFDKVRSRQHAWLWKNQLFSTTMQFYLLLSNGISAINLGYSACFSSDESQILYSTFHREIWLCEKLEYDYVMTVFESKRIAQKVSDNTIWGEQKAEKHVENQISNTRN